MAKQWNIISAYSLIWLASVAMGAALYGADITAETIARNFYSIRIAIAFGALLNAVLLSILLHLHFRKLKLLEERDRLVKELRHDFALVRTMRGIVSVCSYCKKVRNGKGYWEQIEAYMTDNSHARFSHGVCPECIIKLQEDNTDLRFPEVVMPAGVRYSAV